jgi:hypothetical protein
MYKTVTVWRHDVSNALFSGMRVVRYEILAPESSWIPSYSGCEVVQNYRLEPKFRTDVLPPSARRNIYPNVRAENSSEVLILKYRNQTVSCNSKLKLLVRNLSRRVSHTHNNGQMVRCFSWNFIFCDLLLYMRNYSFEFQYICEVSIWILRIRFTNSMFYIM